LISTGEANCYELIFLHLMPGSTDEQPSLAVFGTTDNLRTFQETSLSTQLLGSGPPAVLATIRFNEFTMMGLYPAKPLVTGIRHRIRSSVPVSHIQQRLQSGGGQSLS